MTKLIYDISILVGMIMIGAGVWMSFGLASSLIVVGVLVISLTYGAFFVLRKR